MTGDDPDIDYAAGMAFPAGDEFFKQALIQENGGFQLSHLYTALEYVNDFDCFIEIGAHIGTWSKVLVERFRRGVMFEPVYLNAKCLRINLGYNKDEIDRNAFIVSQYALSNIGEGMVPMYVGRDNSGMHRLGKEHGDIWLQNVCTVNLDTIAFEDDKGLFHVDIRDPSFVKIDVEGHELEVLQGGARLFRESSPVIIMEEYTKGGKFPACDLLKSWNYRIVKQVRKDYIFVKDK
jgi:FkbM family methyltransferase